MNDIINIFHINCNYIDSWLHQIMIEKLETLGISNTVVCPVFSKDGHIVKPNNNVDVLPCFKKVDRLVYKKKQKKILKSIISNYTFGKYDCIHAYTTFTDGNIARQISKKYNVPYVVAIRNTDVNTFFKYMPHLRGIGLKVLQDARYIFFLSRAYYDTVLEKYIPEGMVEQISKKSIIIPNGIDDFWHKNTYINKNINENISLLINKKVRLIYAGRIDKNKNIVATCKAIELLKKEGWNVEFTVVGTIQEHKTFKKVEEYMNYLGKKDKNELIDLYRKADIFVMPSFKESFGLVYGEAMSQGLPVVYTAGQGFDKQFPNGVVGYSVNCRNVEEIKNAIKKIAEKYDTISTNCINNSSVFKWDAICQKYVSIYESILK